MKKKTLVGLVAMIGFAGVLLFNFGSQVGGYMDFEQASASEARAHVVGTWEEDRPTEYDRAENVFTFYMRDESGTVRKVRYEDTKPANFEEAEQVVVEGYADESVFQAESILVKCPSKYNETKDLQQNTADAASQSGNAQP
ncbi:MAG: cytochrome c maturation protein CcmE [Salinivenus sp.]